jgi:hypothetical protein
MEDIISKIDADVAPLAQREEEGSKGGIRILVAQRHREF